MARTKKSPEQWRSDLINAAERLFAVNGVTKTPISAIAKEAGGAAGTFYLYFDSKDDMVNALTVDMAKRYCKTVALTAQSPELSAVEKLLAILEITFNPLQKTHLMDYFHKKVGKEVHLLLIDNVAQRLVPIFEEIIMQGVREGAFKTLHPKESASFIIGAANAISDLYALPEDSIYHYKAALLDFTLKGLGCEDELIKQAKRGL